MDRFDRYFSQLTSNQTQMMSRFDSANSVDETLNRFEDLERCLNQKDLGFVCWKVAYKLHFEEEVDYEKVYYFARRSLKIMIENDTVNSNGIGMLSIPIIANLEYLGVCCCNFRRFDESMKYFNWAVRVLNKVEGDYCYDDDGTVLGTLHRVHGYLFDVKKALGKVDAVAHLRKICEIVEKICGKCSLELAEASKKAAEDFLLVRNYEDALCFCLKALDILKKIYGDNSEEVAECRSRVGMIYTSMGQFERGLESNLLAREALKNLGSDSLFLRAAMDAVHILGHLGRYREIVDTLKKDALPRTEEFSKEQIDVLICLAEALYHDNKFSKAKKQARQLIWTLGNKKEIDSLEAAVHFGKIAHVFELAKDYKAVLPLLRRVSEILVKFPDELWSSHPHLEDLSLRIGSSLRLTGDAESGIPYFKTGIEKMKKNYGAKSSQVGHAYGAIGSAYFDSKKLELAVQAFIYQKDILDEALGPHHLDSILACKSLCKAYITTESHSLAIKILEETIERYEALGPSVSDELDEVTSVLVQLREKKMASRTESGSIMKKVDDSDSDDDEKEVGDSAKGSQSNAPGIDKNNSVEEKEIEGLKLGRVPISIEDD